MDQPNQLTGPGPNDFSDQPGHAHLNEVTLERSLRSADELRNEESVPEQSVGSRSHELSLPPLTSVSGPNLLVEDDTPRAVALSSMRTEGGNRRERRPQ